jgi:hypothetical protein
MVSSSERNMSVVMSFDQQVICICTVSPCLKACRAYVEVPCIAECALVAARVDLLETRATDKASNATCSHSVPILGCRGRCIRNAYTSVVIVVWK